jgi:putative tryptophan/tyrosine transport system substrate-binding protein
VKRREFIVGLGGAAAWPLAARAQRSTVPVIGFFSSQTQGAAEAFTADFRKGLNGTGYVEGHNVNIEYRFADDDAERLATIAAELVSRRVALVVTAGGPATALAVRAVSRDIPLLFSAGTDPVRLGLVASLARPGGNATGVNILITAIESKRVSLLRALLPTARAFALIRNPNSPDAENQLQDIQVAARTGGVGVRVIDVRDAAGIEIAFASIRSGEAVMVAADPLFMSRREQIVTLAARVQAPAIYEAKPFATAGGLMSYGPDMAQVYQQLGAYAGRILKGDRPADLPVVQPTKLGLVINLNTAKALGLTIPETLLATADEVIQ